MIELRFFFKQIALIIMCSICVSCDLDPSFQEPFSSKAGKRYFEGSIPPNIHKLLQTYGEAVQITKGPGSCPTCWVQVFREGKNLLDESESIASMVSLEQESLSWRVEATAAYYVRVHSYGERSIVEEYNFRVFINGQYTQSLAGHIVNTYSKQTVTVFEIFEWEVGSLVEVEHENASECDGQILVIPPADSSSQIQTRITGKRQFQAVEAGRWALLGSCHHLNEAYSISGKLVARFPTFVNCSMITDSVSSGFQEACKCKANYSWDSGFKECVKTPTMLRSFLIIYSLILAILCVVVICKLPEWRQQQKNQRMNLKEEETGRLINDSSPNPRNRNRYRQNINLQKLEKQRVSFKEISSSLEEVQLTMR